MWSGPVPPVSIEATKSGARLQRRATSSSAEPSASLRGSWWIRRCKAGRRQEPQKSVRAPRLRSSAPVSGGAPTGAGTARNGNGERSWQPSVNGQRKRSRSRRSTKVKMPRVLRAFRQLRGGATTRGQLGLLCRLRCGWRKTARSAGLGTSRGDNPFGKRWRYGHSLQPQPVATCRHSPTPPSALVMKLKLDQNIPPHL